MPDEVTKRPNPRRVKREAMIEAQLFEADVFMNRAMQYMKRGTNTLSAASIRNMDGIRWKVNRIRDLAENKL